MILNFFHLERGCGRTTKDITARMYNPHEIFDIYRSADYEQRKDDLYELFVNNTDDSLKIKIVQGHQYYGIDAGLENFQYFTILRHPVEKVISAYQSYRRTYDSPNHAAAMLNTLEEHLDNKVKLHFDNGYTRVFAFKSEEEDQGVPWGKLKEKHFLTAKNRLAEMIVGTTEMCDEFLVYMWRTQGWKIPLYSRANFAKKKHKIEVSEDLRLRIAELNKYDMKLYEFAQYQFIKQLSVVEDYTQKLILFKFLNASLGRLYIGQRLKRLIARRLNDLRR